MGTEIVALGNALLQFINPHFNPLLSKVTSCFLAQKSQKLAEKAQRGYKEFFDLYTILAPTIILD